MVFFTPRARRVWFFSFPKARFLAGPLGPCRGRYLLLFLPTGRKPTMDIYAQIVPESQRRAVAQMTDMVNDRV